MNKNETLAKPSGITLKQHCQNVMSEGIYVESVLSVVFEKYEKRVGKPLGTRLQIVCKHHDDGKAVNDKWQKACKKDYELYKEWEKQNKGCSFSDYQNQCRAEAGKNIRLAATRHEFYSLKQFDISKVPAYILIAIAAHHGKLSLQHTQRWYKDNAIKYWDFFNKLDWSLKDNPSFKEALKRQFEYSGPRGLLQFADHRASASEEGDIVPKLTKFKYNFPHKSKRGVQEIIENNWDNDLLLVRAPTGAGKTDASLLWASLQIKNKRAERLVVAMPTRFTSNALEISVAETLSDTGLYHSSAWFNKFQNKTKNKEFDYKLASKRHELARLLYTPITVCTIDHLLMSLTLMREDHHQVTFNLANSCLVIDEADFYDDFTQANILTLLEALKEWNVPILLMSASLPESVLPSYQKLGFNVQNILEDKSDNKRIRFEIKAIEKYEFINEIEHLLEQCIKEGAAIIYVNTVDKAMLIYDYFCNRGIDTIVYHSRFTEPDKKSKEDELIRHLGKEAWEKGKAKGIAILTQIGEMSINISANLMISEACPIDRLTQRAGRLCRFKINERHKIGELHIIIPHKNDELYPAPYGSFNLKEKMWHPARALSETIDKIEKKQYNAETLVTLLNVIYSKEEEFSVKARKNAKNLKELFISNWLINPSYKTDKEDNDVALWRSRNIPPQDTVFVSIPKNKYFYKYNEYQEWKLSKSISIPVYLIEKYIKNNILDLVTITVYDETFNIWLIREEFYNFEKGIYLPNEDSFF